MGLYRRRLLGVLAAGASGFAGCSGTDGGGGDSDGTPTQTQTPTSEPGTRTTTEAGATDTGTATEAEATETPTDAESTTTATGTGDAEVVEMVNTTFDPLRKSVGVGATVEWVNRDGHGHDVTSAQFHDSAADWSFESDTLGEGDRTTYTFEEAGVYEYYCGIHGESNMCGAVLVGDVSLDESLPCEESAGDY